MQWIKKNNQWVISTNDIKYSEYKENYNSTNTIDITLSDKNKAIVYIPTHNINDVYEWYRIFKDSYKYSNNFDKYGFGIHGYFSKQRGQSIKGWFPNLIEVKATSTNEYKYDNDDTNYYRGSKDFISNFNNISNLIIDDVTILNEDLILLKDQYYETLTLLNIDINLSIDNKYYIPIIGGEEQHFNVNNTVVIKTNTNEFITTVIKTKYTEIVNTNKYLVLITTDIIQNASKIGDIISGIWTKTSFEHLNGVYQYLNFELIPIPEMFDKYKLYNQIIYTYQGKTNQNQEFYLRRVEDKNDVLYSDYPIYNNIYPLIYSKGNAHLIKCEIDYNINPLDPIHPTYSPPYSIDTSTHPYRLLFLDYTIADKILATNDTGIGNYKLIDSSYNDTTNITIPNKISPDTIIFNKVDKNNVTNILNAYDDLYFGATMLPTYEFRYQLLGLTESYNISIDNSTNIVFIQNTNYTTITSNYLTLDKFPANSIIAGDFINITITVFDENKNETYILLKQQFVSQSTPNITSTIQLDLYPKFDENLINELNTFNTLPNTITIDIELVNTYGNSNNNFNNTFLLKDAIDKTIIKDIYNLKYYTEGDNDIHILLNNIKQNHQYKWSNHGINIQVGTTSYYIDHIYDDNIRQYFKGYYNIHNYLSNYLNTLSVNDIDIAQMNDINIQYYNVYNNNNRFGIEGSNKIAGRGNIIYFGANLRDLIIDNIKPDTLIKIIPNFTPLSYVWVSKIEWDYDTNLGKITTLSNIIIPNNGENIKIKLVKELSNISTILFNIFNRTLIDTSDTLYQQYPAYKPDTASYAYALMNYVYNTGTVDKNTKILNDITGIIYKEYNELKISFLKRDKNFLYDNATLTQVDVATVSNININSAPGTIDGYLLNIQDKIVVKDQTILSENNIYIFNGINNPLIPYSNSAIRTTTNWVVINGNVNAAKTFVAEYDLPWTITTDVVFYETNFANKKDNRLTLKPIEIAKLGVDNDTQQWKKINTKYDSIENNENELNIQIGINNRRRIRFIDGLTLNNIINNINGQGQYNWILNEDVIVEDAVVGCTQTNGPGTGTLIWYTGTWVQGIWEDGIWLQGVWESGTWLNGTWNAYYIQDFYYYVTYNVSNNNLNSIWKTGIWYNGNFNDGIMESVTWLNGNFNNGIIQSGEWYNGNFNNGIINHIIWYDGIFTGGDFETGIWYNGTLEQLSPIIPARFGTKSDGNSILFNDKSIWYSGIFKGGEFWSGLNNVNGNNAPSIDNRGSIWYSGQFSNGANFWGGSFITGVFKNSFWRGGVWFGGYYVNNIIDVSGDIKELTIIPDQYDDVLNLSGNIGYIQNTKHRIHTYSQLQFQLIATPTVSNQFTYDSFINEWNKNYSITYDNKSYVINSATDTTLQLNMTINTAIGTTYQLPDPNTHTIDGKPLICAVFENSEWYSGIWLNGYFKNSNFIDGIWVNGHLQNETNYTFGEF